MKCGLAAVSGGKTSIPSDSLVEIDPALFNDEWNREPMRGATTEPSIAL